MVNSGRKRRRSAPIASPLVPRQKRATARGKAQGLPRPHGQAAVSASEQDIVIARLEKEILPLLKPGSSSRGIVKRRLRMGINEVTKYLEASAATALSATKLGSGENTGSASISGSGRAIVLICRDVRPARLLEHLHALVALTGTPHLLLPGASGTLGRLFGFKTMAAFAICPAGMEEVSSQVQPRPPIATTTTTKSNKSVALPSQLATDRTSRVPSTEQETVEAASREFKAAYRQPSRLPTPDTPDNLPKLQEGQEQQQTAGESRGEIPSAKCGFGTEVEAAASVGDQVSSSTRDRVNEGRDDDTFGAWLGAEADGTKKSSSGATVAEPSASCADVHREVDSFVEFLRKKSLAL